MQIKRLRGGDANYRLGPKSAPCPALIIVARCLFQKPIALGWGSWGHVDLLLGCPEVSVLHGTLGQTMKMVPEGTGLFLLAQLVFQVEHNATGVLWCEEALHQALSGCGQLVNHHLSLPCAGVWTCFASALLLMRNRSVLDDLGSSHACSSDIAWRLEQQLVQINTRQGALLGLR